MKNNFKKGFVVQGMVAIIALILIGGGAYYAGVKKVEVKEAPKNVELVGEWKTYNFVGSPYIMSGPMSFKYPSNWKLDTTYYTTPGGSKNITSLTITSPSSIEQVVLSNGGIQGNLTCQGLEKQNSQEPRGKIICKMINKTPFYLTYTTNTQVVEIYNKIIDSIKLGSVNSNTQPSITVLSPNGGEEFVLVGNDSNATIPVSFTLNKPQGFSVYLIDLNGKVSASWATDNRFNQDLEIDYKFNIGQLISGVRVNIVSGKYKVKVCDFDGNNCDTSDSYFTITSYSSDYSSYLKSPYGIQGKCGIYVNSPMAYTPVKFPLTVTGTVNNTNYQEVGCSWGMFEGTAGIAQLYYNNNNSGWKTIGASVQVRVADWTKTNTTFTATLDFNNSGIGLGPNTPMKIVFTEENPSGIKPSDTFELFFNLASATSQPSITVLSPNGGEAWKGGNITWIDDRDVSNVVIHAIESKTGGIGTNIFGNISVRSSGIDGTASYAWDGGGVPPGTYKLNICNTDTKKCDSSDNYFTISQ
jgi:hypothetical protein